MNSRYWEKAPEAKAPIAAYLCFSGRLTVFEKEKVKSYMPTVEKLPYTPQMLTRRQENGRDVPSWWKQVDTFTLEAA